ncbi:uncharacterized protein LOC132269689 [Cornus florida]|uniref:uncharacterized protein LOC132269689 n=1 Tax=Cornus florida TaxID=4283 RepID=UPI00289AD67F|nr:uncharacterized protein LOC132269689 [Cornus florida]
MVSREHKRSTMYRKLQLLRSITNSHAQNKSLLTLDSSKNTEKSRQKVERLNHQNMATTQISTAQDPLPTVKVEAQEEGFLIDVLSERSCTGLLVFVLEAFEELGLEVFHARVFCSDNFHLEAVLGGYENQGQAEKIDAQAVKQAILQAIQNWRESSEQE